MDYYIVGLFILATVVGIFCKAKKVPVRKGTPSTLEIIIAVAILIIVAVVAR